MKQKKDDGSAGYGTSILLLLIMAGMIWGLWPSPTPPISNLALKLPGGEMLKLIKVNAGSFTMGSDEKESGRGDDEKPHRATLTKDYWLGQYEVTQAQWKAVMGGNPSLFKGNDLPVEQVSWQDSKKFCDRLNKLYADKLPGDYRFDLPTEAQWEYAARGGGESGHSFRYSGGDYIDEVAWYYNNSGDREFQKSEESLIITAVTMPFLFAKELNDRNCSTHPVGRKHANALGFYDMSGNVSEWCLDNYREDNRNAQKEFLRGDSESHSKIVKGGSYSWFSPACRPTSRGEGKGNSRAGNIGFRIALVPIK